MGGGGNLLLDFSQRFLGLNFEFHQSLWVILSVFIYCCFSVFSVSSGVSFIRAHPWLSLSYIRLCVFCGGFHLCESVVAYPCLSVVKLFLIHLCVLCALCGKIVFSALPGLFFHYFCDGEFTALFEHPGNRLALGGEQAGNRRMCHLGVA